MSYKVQKHTQYRKQLSFRKRDCVNVECLFTKRDFFLVPHSSVSISYSVLMNVIFRATFFSESKQNLKHFESFHAKILFFKLELFKVVRECNIYNIEIISGSSGTT